MLQHKVLLSYNVDEAIETLPLPDHKRGRVEHHLMLNAPMAYKDPGTPLKSIWRWLPTNVQEDLNEAMVKELED